MQFLRGRAGSHRTWSPPSPPSAGTSSTTPPCSLLIGSPLNFTTPVGYDLAILRVIKDVQDFPRVRRRCTIPPSSTCWIGFDLLQHGVDLAGLDLLGGGVGWIRVGLATNDQYIGINTWRRRICLRTPTSNSSTLCFSPAWLVGGCISLFILVMMRNKINCTCAGFYELGVEGGGQVFSL